MKWGVLGAAAIARKNVRAMLQVPDEAELVAVGSRSIDKARQFVNDMQAYGLGDAVKCYPSYDDVSIIGSRSKLGRCIIASRRSPCQQVIQDSNVQAVYIPLPTPLHLEWVVKAANAKKHVLVEKPVAMTPSEMEEMIKCCEDNQVLFMDGTVRVGLVVVEPCRVLFS